MSGATILVGLFAFGFEMEEKSKYLVDHKYDTVKNAMLQLVPTEPLAYSKLCAEGQENMMHKLILRMKHVWYWLKTRKVS